MSVGGDTLTGVAQLAQGLQTGAAGGRPLSLDLLWQVCGGEGLWMGGCATNWMLRHETGQLTGCACAPVQNSHGTGSLRRMRTSVQPAAGLPCRMPS